MSVISQFSHNSSEINEDNCEAVLSRIAAFEDANLNLSIAIEQEVESSVEELSEQVDKAIDELMHYECNSSAEKKVLCGFLIERFILNDENQDSIRKRICTKVLSEL